jgi:hypothetical protein
MRDALYATLAHNLGLSSGDLAEIGGFSDRFARDLLAGRRPFPEDVQQALLDIQDDIDVLADSMEGDVEDGVQAAILVFRTNADLRKGFPAWPGRGKAAGGFVGPMGIAALTAWDSLRRNGIDVDILFAERTSDRK